MRTAATTNLTSPGPTKAPLAVAAECARRMTAQFANGTGRQGLSGATTSEMTNAISLQMKTAGLKIEIRNG